MRPYHYLYVTTAKVYIPTLIRFDAFNFIHSSLLTSANRMDLLIFHSKIWMFWHGFQTPSWRCVNIRKRRHWRLRLLSWRTAAVKFFCILGISVILFLFVYSLWFPRWIKSWIYVHIHTYICNCNKIFAQFVLEFCVWKFGFWHGKVMEVFSEIFVGTLYKTNLSWQLNCWSLRYSWSIACRHCSNYIFILDLTPGFSGLGKDCKRRGESFQFSDLVRLILKILRYLLICFPSSGKNLPESGCSHWCQQRGGSSTFHLGLLWKHTGYKARTYQHPHPSLLKANAGVHS